VLTNDIAEPVARLISISWKDGIRQGLDRAAQIAGFFTDSTTAKLTENQRGIRRPPGLMR
jgi:hypothetical protein